MTDGTRTRLYTEEALELASMILLDVDAELGDVLWALEVTRGG